MNKKDFLHYGQQKIEQDDIDSVIKVLKSDFLTTGPIVKKFEDKLCDITKSKYSVVCSNGSTALTLAYLSLGIDKETTCIMPSLTFAAAANAARVLGAKVIFCDNCPDSGLVRPIDLINILKKNKFKKAFFIPVHLNGQSIDLESLSTICLKYNIKMIEDASHALGTKFVKGNESISCVGSCEYSEMTTFSFHPVKTITMGEGGAVTTNNKKIYDKLLLFRNNGIMRSPDLFKERKPDNKGFKDSSYYEIHENGFNFRASDINCALGLSQIKKLTKIANKRKKLASIYDNLLLDENWLKAIKKFPFSDTVFHLYVVLINFEKKKIQRPELIHKLRENNIGTMVHYIPLHLQPIFKGKNKLEGAEKYYNQCLSLPLHTNMRASDVKLVFMKLKELIMN
jgi:dTDP-4-amino-4,6-dideoxygalactose transaminase